MKATLTLLLALSAGTLCLAAEHPAEKYAWSFKNFISNPCIPGSSFYTWQRYMETFIGIPAEPANNFGFDYLWFKAAYESKIAAPGNCYGMCLLSALINEKGGYLGYCGPVGQYSGDNTGTTQHMCDGNAIDDPSNTIRFEGPTDPLLHRAIEEMHGHQLNLTTVRHQLEQFVKGWSQDANVAYETVIQEKIQGRPCLVSIIKKKDDMFAGGHTLLAYEAKEVLGQKRIYVYDPNRSWALDKAWYEAGDNYIEINGSDYKYNFGGAKDPWWPVSPGGLITAFPLSVTALRDRTPASLGTSAAQLVSQLLLSGGAGGSASLSQATSRGGRALFVPGTRQPQTDPAKGLLSMVPVLTSDAVADADTPAPESYLIIDPPAGGLDLDVSAGGAGYELVLASRAGRVTVRALSGRGVDRIRLEDLGTLSPRVFLQNRNGAAEMEVEVQRLAGASGGLRKFRLQRISMPRGGLLEIGLDDEGKGLDVVSPLHSVGFDVEVALQEGRAEKTSRSIPVLLGAGEEGSFEPDDWSDPSAGEVAPVSSRLSLTAIEAYCDRLAGPGSGPVGAHFAQSRDVGGAAGGKTSYDSRSDAYTQTSSGADIGNGGDSFQFAYDVVEGDFELTVEILDRTGPLVRLASLARHGLMARKDCTPAAKYSHLETLLLGTGTGGDDEWPRWAYRRVHGDGESTDERLRFNYDPDQAPRFLKMVRRGRTFYGFLSRDGADWRPVGSDTWYDEPAGSPVLVGFASTSGPASSAPSTVRFKVLAFGPIDPALDPLLSDDDPSSGVESYRNGFEVRDGSAPQAMRVSRRSGDFTPQVRGGRLRLTDAGVQDSSVSAFSELVLEDIDSAVHQFDFNVFFRRGGASDPGEGMAFVVTGGADVGRVGFSAGGLGYDLLAREIGTDRNIGRSGFAVELDTVHGAGDAEGAGSPDAPGSLHVGLDGAGCVNTVTVGDARLPDPFDAKGLHVQVRYNRGRVRVRVGPGGAPDDGLATVLTADVLPVSFAGADEKAVFGFTASTGELTEAVEVDDLVATRHGCSDTQEVAIIDGPPAEALVGSVVTLDGSLSNGGEGEDEPVTHSWRVTGGPASIVGPNDGPTVNLQLQDEGDVTVELTVDDGQCDNPASTRVTFLASRSQGNWLRCDSNGDHQRNITDPIVTLGWLFLGAAEPSCPLALDCTSDGLVNITDSIYDLNYLFLGGPPPSAPYPACDSFDGCGFACPR